MSVEAVGASPAENRPTKLSSLSDREHTIPASVLGVASAACLGNTVSHMAYTSRISYPGLQPIASTEPRKSRQLRCPAICDDSRARAAEYGHFLSTVSQ